MNGLPLLTFITFTPLVGGLVLLGVPSERQALARWLALLVAGVSLAFFLLIWSGFNAGSGTMQFEEAYNWISVLGIKYHLGIDGLGLLMVGLTAIVVPMAIVASWQVEHRVQIYFGLLLFLQAGLFGTFTALDFFHWFLFWELSLIPAFFLIRLWGGSGRVTAANQFFVYTMVGSVGLLLAFLAIYLSTGTFDFLLLSQKAKDGSLIPSIAAHLGWYDLTVKRLALVIFAGALLGFAVKTPLFPLHTWLPVTYAEAPIGTTMVLTGLMSKMGVYGFIRILLPIFPEQFRWALKPLLWLAVATIVFSAAAALAQTDLRRILAYSSINHLGYCLLGICAFAAAGDISPQVQKTAALNGVFLQMFNHGLTAATLFWLVGLIEARSGGLRGVNDFGGLRAVAPVFCGVMGIALFSSLGMPGLNGFVGEFLIFKGAFPQVPWAAAVSVFGLLLTAIFILRVLQQLFFGPLAERWRSFPDLTPGELFLLLPAIVLMFVIGIYPQLLVGMFNRTSMRMVEAFGY